MTNHQAHITYLVVRGVPARTIAKSLELPLAEVLGVANDIETSVAVAHYQQRCTDAADIERAPREAAEYLYVRGVSNAAVRKLCQLPTNYWFDVEAKYQYQCKQLEMAKKKFASQDMVARQRGSGSVPTRF